MIETRSKYEKLNDTRCYRFIHCEFKFQYHFSIDFEYEINN